MELTKEEFCVFNLKSRIKLIEKDADFVNLKVVGGTKVISLFTIYQFFIEVVYDYTQTKITRIDPLINLNIIDSYPS